MKKILLVLSFLIIKSISAEISTINELPALKDVLKANNVVVVQFFAKWCRYCNTMESAVENVATVYKNKVKFIKVDIDKGQAAAFFYRVRVLPTLVFFRGGQELFRIAGLQNSDALKNKVNDLLANKKNNKPSSCSCAKK